MLIGSGISPTRSWITHGFPFLDADDEKTSRTKGHFDNLISKACELAKSSFFAETLSSFKLSHPELAEPMPLTHTTDDIGPAHQKWKSRIISSFAAPPVPSSPLIQFASCLGIGPFLRSPAAQHQLALFLLICLYTRLDLSYCEVYDPILTSTERYILTHHFGFRVPDANTEGATSAEQSIQKYSIENPIRPSSEHLPMFFYLPHCGVGLASNVLKVRRYMKTYRCCIGHVLAYLSLISLMSLYHYRQTGLMSTNSS